MRMRIVELPYDTKSDRTPYGIVFDRCTTEEIDGINRVNDLTQKRFGERMSETMGAVFVYATIHDVELPNG